jgi:transcriptional regulator with XRE-family HTH domain
MQVRIKEIMVEKGMSSVSLADIIGVSKVTVSNLINNKTMPSVETLEKIATALNVPMWQLFASPEEIAKQAKNDLCPHCGMPISIKTMIEKI